MRVHVCSAEVDVALESAGRDERGTGPHVPARTVGRPQVRSHYDTVLNHQPFGVGLEQQLATAVKDESTAGVDVVVGVEPVPAAEAEDTLCVLGLHAQGADPGDAGGEPVHERALERDIPSRIVLVHDVVGRGGPCVTGEACGAADIRTDLDDRDGQAVADSAGAGGQPRHARTDDQQIDALCVHATLLRGAKGSTVQQGALVFA